MHTSVHKRPSRKYIGIAKIGYDHTLKQPICVKYRFNDVNRFVIFLKNKYPGLCWMNVFSNVPPSKGLLVGTFGIKKGLQMNK